MNGQIAARTVLGSAKLFTLVLCLGAMPSVVVAARKPAEAELQQIEAYCFKPSASQFEGRECLSKKAQQIRRQVEAAVRKRQFEIDEVAKQSPDDPGLSGQEASEKWRSAFRREQESWTAYEKQRCANVRDFENAGGSNAEGFAVTCSIRLMLERLRELDVGY